jgi:hypothetical protein
MNVTLSLGRLTAFVNAIDEQIARKDCDETIDPLDMIQALEAARKALDAPRTAAESGPEPHVQGNHLVGVYVVPTERALALFKAIEEFDRAINATPPKTSGLMKSLWQTIREARRQM